MEIKFEVDDEYEVDWYSSDEKIKFLPRVGEYIEKYSREYIVTKVIHDYGFDKIYIYLKKV